MALEEKILGESLRGSFYVIDLVHVHLQQILAETPA